MNEPCRITILGASGRMGRALIRAVSEHPSMVLIGAVDHEKSGFLGQDSGVLAGIGGNHVPLTHNALAAIQQSQAVIDFTTPDASCFYAGLTAKEQVVHVIGTTGFDDAQLAKIKNTACDTVIIKSGNMSLGVNLLAALVRQAAMVLDDDFDIEIVEMHHRHKVDAPSGTALLLGEAAAQGRQIDLATHNVRSRDGYTGARCQGDIGFATLRGGSVIGDHNVILAGSGERIELSHKADDRMIFARGALKAALWGQKKPAGFYSMNDVLNLNKL